MTLAQTIAELARAGLRVASVSMVGDDVSCFTAVPADGRSAPAQPAGVAEEEPESDALETFVNRKGLRK